MNDPTDNGSDGLVVLHEWEASSSGRKALHRIFPQIKQVKKPAARNKARAIAEKKRRNR